METWTRKIVAERFREAMLTIRKLPPNNDYGKVLLNMKCIDNELISDDLSKNMLQITEDAMTSLEQTIKWTEWIDTQERKLIWLRAMRVHWEIISLEFGYSCPTAWRRWTNALEKICSNLNGRDC